MKCLDCGYSLRGLPENHCPECARAFDPSDRATFDDDWRSRRGWRRVMLLNAAGAAGPLAWIAMMHVAMTAAAATLGRWPRPMLDDPKGIGGLGAAAYTLANLGYWLVPLGIVVNGGCLAWAAALGRARKIPSMLAVIAAMWLVAIVLGRADPLGAAEWFFD